MKLGTKLVLLIGGGLGALVVIGLFVMNGVIMNQGVDLTTDTMRGIIDSAEHTRAMQARFFEQGAFDMKGLLGQLEKVGVANFRETTLYHAIPVVAAWETGEETAKKNGCSFRVVRDQARNRGNLPTEDESRVSRNIQGISEAAEEASKGAVSLSGRAKELQALAASLAAVVEKFKLPRG